MKKFTRSSVIKLKCLFITALLLFQTLESVPAQNDGRYSFKYPGEFFISGGKKVEFDTSVHKKNRCTIF